MLQYPGYELGDARAHAGQISLGASDAPRDDAGQKEASILRLGLQQSASS